MGTPLLIAFGVTCETKTFAFNAKLGKACIRISAFILYIHW